MMFTDGLDQNELEWVRKVSFWTAVTQSLLGSLAGFRCCNLRSMQDG